MMMVKHTRHAIKSEAVKLVLVHPEPKVAQKKTHNLVVTIVEQPAVPLVVLPPTARVEIMVISAVKLVQSIKNILGGVAMDDVQQDDEAQTVSSVDELL